MQQIIGLYMQDPNLDKIQNRQMKNYYQPLTDRGFGVHSDKVSKCKFRTLGDKMLIPGFILKEARKKKACTNFKINFPHQGLVQESEWLRETLHKWLDDEYCPEPTNIDISRVAAKSFYESLTSKETDLGEILLRMITDLERLSYRESFHGPFSSANAAVRLITEKIGTIADN